MARSHAKLLTRIWADDRFTDLPIDAQWLYMALLSQPTLSQAGVLSLTVKRWASLARGHTPAGVRKALERLTAARFVLVDEDTEEVAIRTLLRHDGGLRIPNMRLAVKRDLNAIASDAILAAVVAEIPDEYRQGLAEGLGQRLAEGSARQCANGSAKGLSRGRYPLVDSRLSSSKEPLPPADAHASAHQANGSVQPGPAQPPDGDDHESSLWQACVRLAEREADRRSDIANRQGWVRARARNLVTEHADAAARLPADASPAQVLAYLDGSRPVPTDPFAAARTKGTSLAGLCLADARDVADAYTDPDHRAAFLDAWYAAQEGTT